MTQLFGRITSDATVATAKNSKKVVNFSIAINDRYKPKDGEPVELVTYIDCSYWRSSEVAAYLTKGTVVEVSGRIFPRAYVNKKNEPVGVISCHVDALKLHGGGSNSKKGNPQPHQSASDLGEDLPF